jgi:hypothetical protein
MEGVEKRVKSHPDDNPEMGRPKAAYVLAANRSHFFDCPSGPELLTYFHRMYMNSRKSLERHCTCACRMPLRGACGLSEEPSNP